MVGELDAEGAAPRCLVRRFAEVPQSAGLKNRIGSGPGHSANCCASSRMSYHSAFERVKMCAIGRAPAALRAMARDCGAERRIDFKPDSFAEAFSGQHGNSESEGSIGVNEIGSARRIRRAM